MKKFVGVFTLICIFALAGAAFAATPQAGKPVQDKPEKTVDRVTTVSVLLEGTDSIGARLGTKLKERFNQSSLFTLNDDEEKDIPKLYVMVNTQPEFAGRPAWAQCILYAGCSSKAVDTLATCWPAILAR